MAESSGFIGNIFKVIQFLVKFLIKLTVNLAVELLKFGVLTLIVLGVVCGSFAAFVYAVRWSYVTSGGNVFYALCAAAGMILVVLVELIVVQLIVKDVLKLTNMTLLELASLYLKPVKKAASKCESNNGALTTSTDDNATDTDKKDT